jgi:hypothetical protein
MFISFVEVVMHKFNLLLTGLFAVLFALPARAQVKVGLVGGVNIADLSGKDLNGSEIDFSSRAAFGAGGVLDATMSKNTGLRFELLYLQKGAEFKATDPDLGTVTVAFKEAYVEMPILLKIDLGSSATQPYFIAGPTIGFNLSSKLEFSATK